jgi:hypothetical protein
VFSIQFIRRNFSTCPKRVLLTWMYSVTCNVCCQWRSTSNEFGAQNTWVLFNLTNDCNSVQHACLTLMSPYKRSNPHCFYFTLQRQPENKKLSLEHPLLSTHYFFLNHIKLQKNTTDGSKDHNATSKTERYYCYKWHLPPAVPHTWTC